MTPLTHKVFVIRDIFRQTLRGRLHASVFASLLNRVKQELEGGNPLLTIYDFSLFNVASGRRDLL